MARTGSQPPCSGAPDAVNPLAAKADYWRFFASVAADGADSPLYALLATRIADGEPQLQALAGLAQAGQPPANMLFGAVHWLLLGGADHPLRRWYPHLAGDAAAPAGADAWEAFCDFVGLHRDAVASLVAARVTNTNEVRRCTYLRAGYAAVAARTGRPLALIEIGPSAGLNLNLDRYAVRYRLEDRDVSCGPTSALELDAAASGPVPMPVDPPAISWRLGLELNPVDLASEADRRWLVALLWPGQSERIARLQRALEIALAHPPPIRAGDALALLPDALAEAPDDCALVVAHSLVTYQWTPQMRADLRDVLAAASRNRPLFRLHHDVVDQDGDPKAMPLVLETWADGAARAETLAEAHHHGASLRWLA